MEMLNGRERRMLAWTLAALGLAVGMLFLGVASPRALAETESKGRSMDAATWRVERPRSSLATLPYTTLVDVQVGQPESMDPHWMYETAGQGVAAQVYETLLAYRRDDPGTLVPQLASSWEVSASGDVYTFTIRPAVRFHAGGTLEAHDVAYSFWRGLLQYRTDGPTWMWFDALFENAWIIDQLPGDDPAKCQAVKEAITYDDARRTVTFHLAYSLAPFLNLLPMASGSILDQEWMAANGDWTGDCANWRDFYDPPAEASILYDQANGTGPFRLVQWTGNETRLARYDGYWRQEPAWPNGPSGPAALEAVVVKYEPDATVRRDMLLQGEADLALVDTTAWPDLEPWLWGVYSGYQDHDPTLLSPDGTLLLFRDLPAMSGTPMQLNHNINPESNPYIGSGTLDGDGIPADFFGDIHVRKAFNYAMDWPALIDDALGGAAIQAKGPIPLGMLGYDDAQPGYFYSPTLSAAEFQQAWGGAAWSQGFSLTVPYNEGNLTRQRAAEILAENLRAINPAFRLNVVEMVWADLLADRREKLLPIYIGGWLEDYHHPHNWVHPFLRSGGAYAGIQNFAPALAAVFDAKIDACVHVTDPSAVHACYADIQNLSYTHAVAVWGYQNLDRRYVRTEVRDYNYAPASPGAPYYYALSKGQPPTLDTVEPEESSSLTFSTGEESTALLDLPAGAVTETSTIVYTPDAVVYESHPGGLRLGGMTFDLQLCQDGECLPGYTFAEPVTLTLSYSDADIAGVLENELYLYTWDGSAWVDIVADCGWPPTAYERHPEINELLVPVCHLSRFALVGATHNIYLPVVLR